MNTTRDRCCTHHVGGIVVLGAKKSAEGMRPVQRVTDLVRHGHRRLHSVARYRPAPDPGPSARHRRRLIEEVEVQRSLS